MSAPRPETALRAAARATLVGRTWALLPGALDALLDALRDASPAQSGDAGADVVTDAEAYARALAAAQVADPSAAPGLVVPVVDGVAVLPITGPMVAHTDWLSRWLGLVSYDEIASALDATARDPSVQAVVLALDTPGGEVSGVGELAAQIASLARDLPVVAHAGDLAASAGYWLAAAAGQVVVATGGVVGSIGVRAAHVDRQQADERQGVRRVEIVSTQSPRKGATPTTDAGRQVVQAMVDDLAQVFIDAVADYRGVTADVVMERFGRGGVVVGRAAVAAGMADAVGTRMTVVRSLQRSARAHTPSVRPIPATRTATMPARVTHALTHPFTRPTASAGTTPPLPIPTWRTPPMATRQRSRLAPLDPAALSDTDSEPEAHDRAHEAPPDAAPAGAAADAPPDAAPSADDAASAAHDAAVQSERLAAGAAVAAAERQRILAILALRAPGHEATITAAVADPTATVESVIARIQADTEQMHHALLVALEGDEAAIVPPRAVLTTDAREAPASESAVARVLAHFRAVRGRRN